MSGRRLPHVIAYDIANPKRLLRVHRYLKKVALPVQYSVFLLDMDTRRLERVLSGLQPLIHERQDDVRVYPLPAKPDWCNLGKPLWDEGILLAGMRLPPSTRCRFDLTVDEEHHLP